MKLLLMSSITMKSAPAHSSVFQLGIDRDREDKREERRDDRPDIGDEAQHCAQHPPEDRVGDADQPEPDADRYAVGRIHDQLHQQISPDPPGGVVQRLGRARQVARSDQADHPIAQIVPLQQHEDHENDDDAGCGERADKRADHRLDQFARGRLGLLHDDGDRLAFLGRDNAILLRGLLGLLLLRLFDLAAKVAQHPRGTLEQTSARRRFHEGIDLALDIGLIGGQARGEVRDLQADDPHEADDQHEGQRHHEEDGRQIGHAQPPQPADRRRQREAQEDGERDRHEDVSAEIEAGDHGDGHKKRQQPGHAGRAGQVDAPQGLALLSCFQRHRRVRSPLLWRQSAGGRTAHPELGCLPAFPAASNRHGAPARRRGQPAFRPPCPLCSRRDRRRRDGGEDARLAGAGARSRPRRPGRRAGPHAGRAEGARS